MAVPIISQSSNNQPGAQQHQPDTEDTGEVQGFNICSHDSEMIQEGGFLSVLVAIGKRSLQY